MSRAIVVLRAAPDRERACEWLRKAPPGTRIEFKGPRRKLPQNDKMWAMLTDIATQLRWHGRMLKAEQWKLLCLHGFGKEMDLVPSLDGTQMVDISRFRSSSDLSKEEMSQFIEYIYSEGTRLGVIFDEEAKGTEGPVSGG